MSQDQTKKEALFNEVKGSLFEYLVAKEIAKKGEEELSFQSSLDRNYLNVLSQQDRMVRQFYPEMLPFLSKVSSLTANTLMESLKEVPKNPKVVGKFSNSTLAQELFEADLVVSTTKGELPISLKLNKKNAFVNTKSGGIKSFFTQYFSFLETVIQQKFNLFVDLEFNRMAYEVHALYELDYPGNFDLWVKKGFSELPGELNPEAREILKAYYARIAQEMHNILTDGYKHNPEAFKTSLPALMGFGSHEILQVICFHEFPSDENAVIDIHSYQEVESELSKLALKPFNNISSVEVEMGSWSLHIRVKPMNKFTTTAIKINCSVRVKRPNVS